MRINIYKLIWIGLALVILLGIGISCYYFAGKESKDNNTTQTQSVPDYQASQIPGEIVWQASSTEDNFVRDIESPAQDVSLFSSDAPLSPAVIKAPTEPALPPKESDILKLQINQGIFNPSQVIVNQKQAVILQVSSLAGNYIFYIEGIGVAEAIYENQPMTISFQAPSKVATLRYYCEEYETGNKRGEGKLIVQ